MEEWRTSIIEGGIKVEHLIYPRFTVCVRGGRYGPSWDSPEWIDPEPWHIEDVVKWCILAVNACERANQKQTALKSTTPTLKPGPSEFHQAPRQGTESFRNIANRFWKVIAGIFTFATGLVAWLGIYPLFPKIAVEPELYYSKHEPLKSAFRIENRSIFPLYDIEYGFLDVVTVWVSGGLSRNNLTKGMVLIPELAPDRSTTRRVGYTSLGGDARIAVIEVHVSYRASWTWWRSSVKVFPFRAERNANNEFVWTHLSESESRAIAAELARGKSIRVPD